MVILIIKKARSEKEALLEQFAILSNTLPDKTKIKVFLLLLIIDLVKVNHGDKSVFASFLLMMSF